MLLISKTYEIITPESAEYGEADEIGFVFENEAFGFREVVDYLKHCAPSQYPITNPENVWFTTHGDTDYKTGNVTQECFHYSRENQTKNLKYWKAAIIAAGFKVNA